MELYVSSPLNLTPHSTFLSNSLPFPVKNCLHLTAKFQPRLPICRSKALVVATASNYSNGYCDFSSLNTPIEPKTPAGRFLSGVLLNDRNSFHDAVAETVEKLVAELDDAYARMALTVDSTEACLHRRIAEMKSGECQTAVEDVMYVLILYKFSEIRVHLIPPLSKCIYNGRLEILPSKDWELESIHSIEVMEMIKHYLTSVTGWRPDFNVTESWAITKTTRVDLCQIYTSSILFGYFLKSAVLRHQLEMSLLFPFDDMVLKTQLPCRVRKVGFGRIPPFGPKKKLENLRLYLMGFATESLVEWAQPNSKEALNLMMKHSCALFGGESEDEIVLTSFASLKRFVLEGVAFGSFLWDSEEYVKTVYNLEEIK